MNNEEVTNAATNVINAITDAVKSGKIEWERITDHPPEIQEVWKGVINGPIQVCMTLAKDPKGGDGGAAISGGLMLMIPSKVATNLINAARVESKIAPTKLELN